MDLPTAVQGTSPFDALLTQCRDLVGAQLDKAIAGMLEKADEALAELAVKTQDREAQKLYLAARDAAGARCGGVKVFGLPAMGGEGSRRHVELGVRGDPAEVGDAIDALRREVREAGFEFREP